MSEELQALEGSQVEYPLVTLRHPTGMPTHQKEYRQSDRIDRWGSSKNIDALVQRLWGESIWRNAYEIDPRVHAISLNIPTLCGPKDHAFSMVNAY